MHEQAMRAQRAAESAGMRLPAAPPTRPDLCGVVRWWAAAVNAVADRVAPKGSSDGASVCSQADHARLAHLAETQRTTTAALEAHTLAQQAELERVRARRAELRHEIDTLRAAGAR